MPLTPAFSLFPCAIDRLEKLAKQMQLVYCVYQLRRGQPKWPIRPNPRLQNFGQLVSTHRQQATHVSVEVMSPWVL